MPAAVSPNDRGRLEYPQLCFCRRYIIILHEASTAVNADASAWSAKAQSLAAWCWERLVNRTDAWGGYRPEAEWGKEYVRRDGTTGKLGEQTTRKGTLTPATLVNHFRARSRPAILGLHSTSQQNTSKWGAVDVDWHGPTSTGPEVNWRAALAWYRALAQLGFHPLLTDSNGQDGYHLRVLLAEPAPTACVFWFLRQLVSDHARLGMLAAPETFPKQAALKGGCKYGNWLRLPGRHHKRPHWSRVWDGDRWLAGEEAIGFLLQMGGDPPDLVPVDAELRFRIGAYRAELPNLGEGQGRDDVAFRFACFLVRDLSLADADALRWLEEWDQGNHPPKGREALSEILANAHQYGQRGYGCGLGDRTPPPPAPRGVADAAELPGACEIILDYFRRKYAPVFRRGEVIYSPARQAEVRVREACLAPDRELRRLLLAARDCPKDIDGKPRPEAVPGLFKKWASSAWVDLLDTLPEEEETAEVVDAAGVEFRRHVAACLYTHATFGEVLEGDKDVTVTQRRSLIDWAQRWAKRGAWRQVRSALLWTRLDDEGRLLIALRCGLFSQYGPRELASCSQRKFCAMAEHYGIGKADRACGVRVVELTLEFISELLVSPSSAETTASREPGEEG